MVQVNIIRHNSILPRPVMMASALAAPATLAASTANSSSWSTLLQMLTAFIIAGFGNVGAGLILDYVKEWPVFLHVNELFILVPSLLGLKGNLEMTMASRLSTQANLGHMDNVHELIEMAKGNLALVQTQATVVSFVVAIFASFVKAMSVVPVDGGEMIYNSNSNGASGAHAAALSMTTQLVNNVHQSNITSREINVQSSLFYDEFNDQSDTSTTSVESHLYGFDWNNALILTASSLLTANIACFVLGTVMILVIVGSHKIQIDPDNIASPVAASLGDMTTAALLAVLAHSIYTFSENQKFPYLALIITLLFLLMLPIWTSVARSNPYTSSVITKGWTPIVIAVFISSCGGFILEHGKARFSRLPVYQPVINGVGGNLVAVQASRLSTSLHRYGKPGQLQNNFKLFTSPIELFLSKTRNDINLKTARILLFMAIPAHLLYFYVIHYIDGGNAAYNSPIQQQPVAASATVASSSNIISGLSYDNNSNLITTATTSTLSTTSNILATNPLPVTVIFLSLYMLFAVLQVAILLYLAQNLVNILWKYSIDPDNYSTPLLTATGDLLGCAFLLAVFIISYQLNDPYALTIV